MTSAKLRPAARTLIRSCPGPGSGSGVVRTSRTSGPPWREIQTERMPSSIPPEARRSRRGDRRKVGPPFPPGIGPSAGRMGRRAARSGVSRCSVGRSLCIHHRWLARPPEVFTDSKLRGLPIEAPAREEWRQPAIRAVARLCRGLKWWPLGSRALNGAVGNRMVAALAWPDAPCDLGRASSFEPVCRPTASTALAFGP
jgi:hypothetical protein